MQQIDKKVLLKILRRSFYIQGSWNYQRMLNLGFCYAILPLVDRLYPKSEDRKRFLKRHLEFFNAHPYFASFALGATARLEEQYCNQRWESDKPIAIFKNRLCGPLGAIGDRLFWGTIRPLVAMIGVLISIIAGVLGPILLFVAYNIPHIYLRYFGVMRGYELGFDIVRELSKRKYEGYTRHLQQVGAGVLGAFVGFFAIYSWKTGGAVPLAWFLLGGIGTLPFVRWKKPILFPIILVVALFAIFYILEG